VRAAAEGAAGRVQVALHPTSHLVHLDCLLDGKLQGSAATLEERARTNLLGLEPVFFGDMHRCATATDVDAALAGDEHPRVLVLEVPQVRRAFTHARTTHAHTRTRTQAHAYACAHMCLRMRTHAHAYLSA
jgi:hypothetical protein